MTVTVYVNVEDVLGHLDGERGVGMVVGKWREGGDWGRVNGMVVDRWQNRGWGQYRNMFNTSKIWL
jgi:hypothetical protein